MARGMAGALRRRRGPPREGVALRVLHDEITECRRCPRLVAWRERVARVKVRRFLQEDYWGRPVPGFGDPRAAIVILGLAPGAHGANRTGRAFTGDRSGDFLFAALHRAGLASQPTSVSRGDGLTLDGVFISLALRCAPPGNAPLPGELRRCAPFLDREIDLLVSAKVIVALGAIAWNAYLLHRVRQGKPTPRPAPKFGHGATAFGDPALLGSFHVSQQNTQTGKLTAEMFDQVLAQARQLAR